MGGTGNEVGTGQILLLFPERMTALDEKGRVPFLQPKKVVPSDRRMYTPIHQVIIRSYSRILSGSQQIRAHSCSTFSFI